MKKLEYLSPTSIQKFDESIEEFYLWYLADVRSPREPQNQPMSIGSAFDAYAKSYLHDVLFGKNHPNSNRFEFETIFEAQVEEHNRDWARIHGKYAFEQYKSSGALLDLLSDLKTASGDPRFEFDVRGAVNGYRDGTKTTIGEVTLLGKPDCTYVNRAGAHVVLDWKVNGYCSKWPTSPMQGYIRLRSAGGTNHGQHKNCSPFEHAGMTINIGAFLEHHEPTWARQLSIYAWLCGEPVGSDFIVAIDQLACNAKGGGLPSIRVAEHRLRVHEGFQQKAFNRACEIWEIVHSDHIFRNLSKTDSQKKCELLDQQAEALYGANMDPDFLEFTRRR